MQTRCSFTALAYPWIKRTVYSDTHQRWHLPPPAARCCCSVKHKNAPARDYGVTLVHSPRQPGWLLTGNPGATRHLGVEAWKMFCMLQQSLWSQSGKRHRWFFTLQLSSVCKEALLALSCWTFIVVYFPNVFARLTASHISYWYLVNYPLIWLMHLYYDMLDLKNQSLLYLPCALAQTTLLAYFVSNIWPDE